MPNLENTKVKKSFALLTTLLLLIIFSFLSISIVETNLLGSNLNKLKYLHLQATIYEDDIIKYINTHKNEEIKDFVSRWNDTRFTIDITNDDTNSSIYYISIKTNDDSHIRLSQKIIK